MENKKKFTIALLLFIFLGLTIFTFANPADEQLKEGNGGDVQEEDKKPAKEDKKENNSNVVAEPQENPTRPTLGTNNNPSTTTPSDNSYDLALSAVEKAESVVDEETYQQALELVNKVTNNSGKEELATRLEEVKNGIDAKELVAQLETKTNDAANYEDMNSARDFREVQEIIEKVSALQNEEVKDELEEKLEELAKLLDDTTAPELNIEDEAILSEVTKILAEDDNEFTMILTSGDESQEITSGKEVADGVYTLKVVDAAFNEEEITFTVDTKAPSFNVTSGTHSKESIDIAIDDLTLDYVEVYNQDTKQTTKETSSNFTLKDEATYRLTAYDKTGRKTTVWVAIDKTAPTITEVEDGKYYNKNLTITIEDKFLTEVTVNGEKQDGIKTTGTNNEGKTLVLEVTDGTYTIVAKDKVGNTTTVTFTVDTTVPKFNFGNGKIVKEFTVEVTDDNFDYMTVTNMKTGKTETINTTTYELPSENADNLRFDITAYDKAGNKTKTLNIYVDNTNPVFEGTGIVAGTEEALANNGVYQKVTLKATDGSLKKIVRVNGSEEEVLEELENNYNTNKVMTYENTFDADGTYTIKATDRMGNTETITFTVDTTAPERVYSTIRPTAKMEQTAVKNNGKINYYVKNGDSFVLAVSYTEELQANPIAVIGGKEVELVLNEKVKANEGKYLYEGTFTIALDEAELKEGNLEITIKNVIDLAGNEATTATALNQTRTSNGRSVIYDRTIPTIEVQKTSVGNGVYSKLNIQIRDVNSVAKVIINGKELTHNGRYVDINDGDAYRFVEGENTVVAYDRAGNMVEQTFTVDRTAPDYKAMGILPTSHYAKAGDKITVNVQFLEKLEVKPQLKINGEVVENAFNDGIQRDDVTIYSAYYTVTDKDKQGAITVEVYGYADKAGNVGTPITLETAKESKKLIGGQDRVIIDTVAPKIKVQPTSVGNGIYSKLNIQISDVNSVAKVIINGKELTHNGRYVDINDGHAYRFVEGENTVVAYDKAGNKVEQTFTVDRTAPTIKVQPTSVGNGIYSKLNIQIFDVNFVAKVIINGKELTHTGRYVDINDGHAYTFVEGENTVVAYDKAGNKVEQTFTVDKTKPVISFADEVKVEGPSKLNILRLPAGVEFTYERLMGLVSATDNVTTELEIKVDHVDYLNGPVENNIYKFDFSNGLDSKLTGANSGRYNVYYETTDEAGNKGTACLLVIFTDKEAPVLTINEKLSVGSDGQYSKMVVNASDNAYLAYYEINGKRSTVDNAIIGVSQHGRTFLNDTIKGHIIFGEVNTIVAYDKAGNRSNVIEFVADQTAPDYKMVGILPTSHYAKLGDKITVNVQFLERLAVKPQLKINGELIENAFNNGIERGDVTIYTAYYTVTESSKQGDVAVEVYDYADKAGNVGTPITLESSKEAGKLLNGQHKVTIDTTPATITLNRDDNYMVEYGSEYKELGATVTDNVDETSVIMPRTYVVFDMAMNPTGQTVQTIDTTKSGRYLAIYDYTDKAGNKTETYKRWVIVKENPVEAEA